MPTQHSDRDEEPGGDEAIDPERLEAFFGAAWPAVSTFAALLAAHGPERGLLGPRELPRLWQRHLLNSAALAGFLPGTGDVADVGSGAGLPGVVLAAMRPDLGVHLVEPMQRRVRWLHEVVADLGLTNVTVYQARAEELHDRIRVAAVTARAVAPMDRLGAWTLPLVPAGGRLVVLKGQRAAEELEAAAVPLRRSGAVRWRIHVVDVLDLGEPTSVVEVVKGRGGRDETGRDEPGRSERGRRGGRSR